MMLERFLFDSAMQYTPVTQAVRRREETSVSPEGTDGRAKCTSSG